MNLVICSAMFDEGPPFKQYIYMNPPYLISICLLLATNIYFIIHDALWSDKLFEVNIHSFVLNYLIVQERSISTPLRIQSHNVDYQCSNSRNRLLVLKGSNVVFH
jgi:hypothetical protein